jgi:hypothetical protein
MTEEPAMPGIRTRTRVTIALLLGSALLAGTMGISCDHDAQTVFRQTSTDAIGEGVKTILSGNPEEGVADIVTAGIDGLVASIEQAGRGTTSTK